MLNFQQYEESVEYKIRENDMERNKKERKIKRKVWRKSSNFQQEWNPKVKRNSFNFFQKSEEMYYNLVITRARILMT